MIRLLLRTVGIAVGSILALFAILTIVLLVVTLLAPKDTEAVYIVLAILLIILGIVNWSMLGTILIALHRHPDLEGLQQRAQESLLSAIGGTCIALVGLHLMIRSVLGPPYSSFFLVIGVCLLSSPAILFGSRYWPRPWRRS